MSMILPQSSANRPLCCIPVTLSAPAAGSATGTFSTPPGSWRPIATTFSNADAAATPPSQQRPCNLNVTGPANQQLGPSSGRDFPCSAEQIFPVPEMVLSQNNTYTLNASNVTATAAPTIYVYCAATAPLNAC